MKCKDLLPGDIVTHALFTKTKPYGIVLDVWFNFLNREICTVAWYTKGKYIISECSVTIVIKLKGGNI